MPDKNGSLLVLAEKLRSLGLPSLSALIAQIGEIEEYHEFITIVREFLPEREKDILHNPTPASQIAAFASYFEDRYFPLEDNLKMGDIESYYDLIRGIPVSVYGISWDDYHEIASDYREGYQLMTYLIAAPYEGDARIALAEACLQYVPQNLLEQVPEGGIPPDEASRILDGTRYIALAHWGNILWSSTGNFFLDTCYEELWNEGLPEWSRGTVESLTRQWQQVENIQEEVFNFNTWLEEEPAARFEETLNFILEKRKHESRKRAKRLPVGAAGES